MDERLKQVQTGHGPLPLPAFLPDGTMGVVRGLGPADLKEVGIEGFMVNTLHLWNRPGISLIESLGGIHSFTGWGGPIASDSGGFQMHSLIRRGRVSSEGFVYKPDGGKKRRLTPETCIQKQFQLGADIMFCLDHCTHPDEDSRAQTESVERTVTWSRRCKAEFNRLLDSGAGGTRRLLLFGVVHGGKDRALRLRCAESLFEIGFDGYGFGGWPIDKDGRLLDIVGFVAEQIPEGHPIHGLGIGNPDNLMKAHRFGYDLFDCVMPTRDARQGRLYTLEIDWDGFGSQSEDFWRYLYIGDERFARDGLPVDERCDCPCCSQFTRGYLHHLFKVKESLGKRLATLHNLRFYAKMMERLRC